MKYIKGQKVLWKRQFHKDKRLLTSEAEFIRYSKNPERAVIILDEKFSPSIVELIQLESK